MDIGRSFNFVTQDPNWIAKVLITAVVMAVPVVNFAATGYCLEVIRRTYQGTDLPLPEWEQFGDYFVRGLIIAVGTFLWSIPLYIIWFCPFVLLSAGDNGAGFGLLFCIVFPVVLALAALVIPVLYARFALKPEFGTLFEFNEIIADIREGIGPLLIFALAAAGIFIVAAIAGMVACFVGILLTLPYAYLVVSHLLGQTYRQLRPPAIAQTPVAF